MGKASSASGWAFTGVLAAVMAAVSAAAQARQYQPGEMVRMEGGEAYRIVQCFGTGEWDDCEVEAFQDGRRARTGTLRMSIRNLRAGEARRAAAAGQTAAPPAAPAAAPRPPNPRPAAPPVAANPRGPAASMCTWTAPGPAVTARTAFSQALARRRIFDHYAARANGSGSAPQRVGVVFLGYTPGASYRNTVQNVPGQGAQRRHAGAPVNATVHTFRSRHMVCEQYRDGTVARRVVEGTHACYVSRDDEWVCASENDTRITQLDQE
ncbi:MAG TPA: hypothetical protein VF665_23515 [Longimicrobium sp.]|uniref:hypothetical protein n=1 Tax=Longimicrobium sp. TaxID=2029185 RepID=UPI002EDBAFB4